MDYDKHNERVEARLARFARKHNEKQARQEFEHLVKYASKDIAMACKRAARRVDKQTWWQSGTTLFDHRFILSYAIPLLPLDVGEELVARWRETYFAGSDGKIYVQRQGDGGIVKAKPRRFLVKPTGFRGYITFASDKYWALLDAINRLGAP